jgi:hypothetical protein
MTRQIMRAYQSLDIMFLGSSQLNSQLSRQTLPSWAQNWLDRDILNAIVEDEDKAAFISSVYDFRSSVPNQRPPHNDVLNMYGFVYETISYCSGKSDNDGFAGIDIGQPGEYYSGYPEFQDAVYECLLETEHQSYLSPRLPNIEARKSFVNLVRPHPKTHDLDLRHFIHDFHIRSHYQSCGRSYDLLGKFQDKESHFEAFLCYHPDFEADFESTLLTTARELLGEALSLIERTRSENEWRDPDYLRRVRAKLTRKFRSETFLLAQYQKHRIFARNFFSAALEKRQLSVLQNGQVCKANGHVRTGDKICRIRGCSRPVVLRERTLPCRGYRLVSDAVLSFTQKDVVNQSIFAPESGDRWWERKELRDKVEIFAVS